MVDRFAVHFLRYGIGKAGPKGLVAPESECGPRGGPVTLAGRRCQRSDRGKI